MTKMPLNALEMAGVPTDCLMRQCLSPNKLINAWRFMVRCLA
jgi:hypothetical protein